MREHCILDADRNVVPVSLEEWGEWLNTPRNRRVANDLVGGVRVSTVFLSLDCSFDDGPPLWFETMIFGGPHDGYQDRCTTWAEAEAQHAKALALVKEEQNHADAE